MKIAAGIDARHPQIVGEVHAFDDFCSIELVRSRSGHQPRYYTQITGGAPRGVLHEGCSTRGAARRGCCTTRALHDGGAARRGCCTAGATGLVLREAPCTNSWSTPREAPYVKHPTWSTPS